MTEARPHQDKRLEMHNDGRSNPRDEASDRNRKEDAMFVLFAPGNKEGTRVTVRNVGEDTSGAEPIRKGSKQGILFVQTNVALPIGTVVTLAIPGAYDVKEQQQSFEGAVSFVCPTADQFGYSSGLGIRVAGGSQEK